MQNENQAFEIMLKIFTFRLYLQKIITRIKDFLYKKRSNKIS